MAQYYNYGSRIVFLKISWLKYYKGKDAFKEYFFPIGEWVKNNDSAAEELNFKTVAFPDDTEYCMGYVSTKSQDGVYGNQLHLERLDKNAGNSDCLEDVLVIWCSEHEAQSPLCVVGWYQHANVYRYYRNRENINENADWGDWPVNICAEKKDCFLLSPDERPYWKIIGKSRGGFSYGRTLVRYAYESSPAYLEKISKKIQDYSRNHADQNYIDIDGENDPIEKTRISVFGD